MKITLADLTAPNNRLLPPLKKFTIAFVFFLRTLCIEIIGHVKTDIISGDILSHKTPPRWILRHCDQCPLFIHETLHSRMYFSIVVNYWIRFVCNAIHAEFARNTIKRLTLRMLCYNLAIEKLYFVMYVISCAIRAIQKYIMRIWTHISYHRWLPKSLYCSNFIRMFTRD